MYPLYSHASPAILQNIREALKDLMSALILGHNSFNSKQVYLNSQMQATYGNFAKYTLFSMHVNTNDNTKS